MRYVKSTLEGLDVTRLGGLCAMDDVADIVMSVSCQPVAVESQDTRDLGESFLSQHDQTIITCFHFTHEFAYDNTSDSP